MPKNKKVTSFSKEEIIIKSKKISQIVRDFKIKMQELKQRQNKIMEDYIKSIEKMAIKRIREQLE